MFFQPRRGFASFESLVGLFDDHVAEDNGIEEALDVGHGLVSQAAVDFIGEAPSVYGKDLHEVNLVGADLNRPFDFEIKKRMRYRAYGHRSKIIETRHIKYKV